MSIASKYVDQFLQGMHSSGIAMYNKTASSLKNLETNSDGKLISGTWNTNTITEIASILIDFLDSPTYELRVNTLIDSVSKITSAVTQDMMKLGNIPAPVINDALKLEARYRYALEGVLTDQAVESATVVPFINDVFYAIGSSKSLSSFISESRPKLTDHFVAYFVTKVTTLLEQYERDLMLLYSANFGIDEFIFDGPKDDRNRGWCHSKVGKKYTAKQISNWVIEEWGGKIPGTTASSIYVNLGGYNCRHILKPIKRKRK